MPVLAFAGITTVPFVPDNAIVFPFAGGSAHHIVDRDGLVQNGANIMDLNGNGFTVAFLVGQRGIRKAHKVRSFKRTVQILASQALIPNQ